MNFEQHDNFLLADWVCPHSPLSAAGQKEIDQLEEFYHFAYEQAAKDRVQAVLWLQKVPCYDASQEWLNELSSDILRDQLRHRILRLHKLTRLIRSAPLPWIYVTEKDCCGTMFELMQACHKRYVFDRETWFGFPEFTIGQVSPLGWLGAQLQTQPALANMWQSRSVISAEEGVQIGVITAALTWRDWRRHLIAWMQQQIESLVADRFTRRDMPSHPSWSQDLWPSLEITKVGRSHIESYRQISTQPIPYKTVDRDLIDTASHFMMQSPYEHWLKQEVVRRNTWGRQSIPKLIFFEVSESIPPMSTFCRLLDRGVRLVIFAQDADVVRLSIEAIFNHLNARYSRSEIQQLNRRISWFAGPPVAQPEIYTMRFGSFREFVFSYRDVTIQGWALGTQKMSRQTVEIYGDRAALQPVLRAITDVFDGVYLVGNISPDQPLLFRVRSLILQMLVYYCQDSGTPWNEMLEQLAGMGWSLVGNPRFWERFLEFRKSMKTLEEPLPALRNFCFDAKLLKVTRYSELVKLSAKRHLEEIESGPGFLQRCLISFVHLMTTALFQDGYFETFDCADLYISDAIGFPAGSGSPAIFIKRLGSLRVAEAKYAMEVRSY